MSNVYDCSMLDLPRFEHERGTLTVVENGKSIPFDCPRVFYLYDIKGGASRGGHAHKEAFQLIVAVSGSFVVSLDDGNMRRSLYLNRQGKGLLVPPGIWAVLDDFSSGSVCLVLTSETYSEQDYIRNYDEFLAWKKLRVNHKQ